MAEALLPGAGARLLSILYLGGNLCDEISPLPPTHCWPLPGADRNFLLRPAEELGWLLQGQPQCEEEQKARRQALLLSKPRGLRVLVLLHGWLGRVSSSLLAAPGPPLPLSTDLSRDLHSTDWRGWMRLGWMRSGAQRQPGSPAPAPGTMLPLVPISRGMTEGLLCTGLC